MRTVTIQVDVPELTKGEFADLNWTALGFFNFVNFRTSSLIAKGLLTKDGTITNLGKRTLDTPLFLVIPEALEELQSKIEQRVINANVTEAPLSVTNGNEGK